VLQEFAVLFVDLDDFKLVNESFGHQVADDLLRDFAATLDGLVRTIDALHPPVRAAAPPRLDCVLSRLGGDEFALLVPGVKDRAAAGSVAEAILRRLERPLQAGNRHVVVTASIGIALYPSDGQTVDSLLSNADEAMYAAKRRGKARYEHYREASNTEAAGDTAVRSSRQMPGASLTSVASPVPASP
jgi:GGDEF domain-containing protein